VTGLTDAAAVAAAGRGTVPSRTFGDDPAAARRIDYVLLSEHFDVKSCDTVGAIHASSEHRGVRADLVLRVPGT
jgi:endonuclease/exonuclease/phosphatase family metal-dependent hydrolase